MSKLANLQPKAATAKIKTRSHTKPDTETYEGGSGFTRKSKGELFLFAVTNMVGEDTFYEQKGERDTRFRDLVAKVTKSDPDWVARFIPFLRNEMNMRSASIVMAVEYVRAGGANGRKVIDSAIARADEPAETLGYYRARFGRNIPQPIKRGVADAVRRLYNERSALKYDGDNAGFRMGDVIDIVHPEPKADWQNFLFKYLLDKRHNRAETDARLPMIATHDFLMALSKEERRVALKNPQVLEAGGMTWESVSGWLQGPMDAEAWEAIIPSMGYMALLRNLRNFEEAKVSAAAMDLVYAKLADPEQVAESRQFPIRFYSAFKNIQNLKAKAVLNDAIEGTLQNVPVLKGRTLILVDNSGSMASPFSKNGSINLSEAAGLFGSALALRAEKADLYKYGSTREQISFTPATPLLKLAENFSSNMGGTETFAMLNAVYDGQDRVIILTDEQAFEHAAGLQGTTAITKPIYTFNLNGYRAGHLPSGKDNRYTFGGLTDAGFKMIELLEAGQNDEWPF